MAYKELDEMYQTNVTPSGDSGYAMTANVSSPLKKLVGWFIMQYPEHANSAIDPMSFFLNA